MGRDQRKRSREVDGGGGHRKKERETKGKDVESDPVVVAPPTEDEVDEFFAILRRMREAVKYFEKSKLPDPSREVKKRSEVGLLDLNTVPDKGE
ncbi:hypothetical protein L1987_24946 [Smallanthus sonchifolius]|uniref:Uncharacterized protein n=1 Tax=Smallanthus sonchifolius TaxID=185202 RepID=A0ACB9IMG1_9ASTR|nr:hypothetical protein L1987_24946 [Smallanthus sonchifolius]